MFCWGFGIYGHVGDFPSHLVAYRNATRWIDGKLTEKQKNPPSAAAVVQRVGI
jgi:hypothetical protein